MSPLLGDDAYGVEDERKVDYYGTSNQNRRQNEFLL